jgi:hypothetical protein
MGAIDLPDEKNEKPRRRNRQYNERIHLTKEALDRVTHWSDQISQQLKGSKVTRSAIVEWLVIVRPSELSESEISELQSKHFDEVKFAAWALKELKAAKARGEALSMSDLLSDTSRRTP